MKHYATYLRVSTQRQGRSGLGLDSQRKMCADFITANGGTIVNEFVDVESGTHRNRKGLLDAISYCKQNDCPLVIAKLDRLARDVEFCFKVINTGIEIHFVDMPQINTLLLGVFASVAQYERELTSDRTKKALAAKKARGEKLGAACEKYKESIEKRTKEEQELMAKERGKTRTLRYLQSRDVQAFLKVLRNVFAESCVGNPQQWNWDGITTRGDNKLKIWQMMTDYKEMDDSGKLFHKWKFDEPFSRAHQVSIASYIQHIRKSVLLTRERGWND